MTSKLDKTTAKMSGNDELLPEQTEGFKVGEKKTIDEYHQMGTFISSAPISVTATYSNMTCPQVNLLFFQVLFVFSPRLLAAQMEQGSASLS